MEHETVSQRVDVKSTHLVVYEELCVDHTCPLKVGRGLAQPRKLESLAWKSHRPEFRPTF